MLKKLLFILTFTLIFTSCNNTENKPLKENNLEEVKIESETQREKSLIIIGTNEGAFIEALGDLSSLESILIVDNLENSEEIESIIKEAKLNNTTLLKDTKAVSVLFNENGGVRGVNTEKDNELIQYPCKSVVINIGKYTEDNKNLLLPFDKNENNELITKSGGLVSLAPEKETVPTKCGVPLKVDNREDIKPITLPEPEASRIDGLYAIGDVTNIESSKEEIDLVIKNINNYINK